MKTLSIDIETFSSVDIKKAGMYKYAESPDFEILLFAYSIDGAPAEVIDFCSYSYYSVPVELYEALIDPNVLKTAHNAGFERTCISKYFDIELPPSQWECTMAKAAQAGLPLSLDQVSKVLKLANAKMAEGKKLIRQFCIPCKPTAKNGQRTRNLPEHDPEAWELFKQYCAGDVNAEQEIRKRLEFFQIPAAEKKIWVLDQTINDRGVLVDRNLVSNAIAIDTKYRAKLEAEAIEITGLQNPNSAAQLKEWLATETSQAVTKLRKEDIPEILKTTDDENVKRILHIRTEMSKTSVKKYTAINNVACEDNRVRGVHQYYGASRTGRWAGRLVQMQNLPTNTLKDLDLARQLVAGNDYDLLEMLYGNVPDTLSQLIRTAFIAPPGERFLVADFSAIEARVIAWLAGEKWRLNVFSTHGKIYEASAAAMFKVPLEAVTKDSQERKKGKIAELALGFGGAVDALLKMGAKKMGLNEDELPKLVKMWRNANTFIVNYWRTCGDAAVEAVTTGKPVTITHGITFAVERNTLYIKLPSGRRLSYIQPTIVTNRFGGPSVAYLGLDQTTKQWARQETYGGKIVENIVQATARDCLAYALLKLDEAGYNIVFHVHDEIVSQEPYGKGSLEEVNKIMGTGAPWAKGLPLAADSYETEYYKKD